MVVNADVSDRSQMKLGVAQVLARFGPINGVLHAAGIVGVGAISMKTKQELQAVLAPKVLGTLVLEEVLSNQPLDFFILFSSLASLEGGLGQVAYTAANAFLDAYAQRSDLPTAQRTISINWDIWHEIEMTSKADLPEAFRQERKQQLERALDTSEALEAFLGIAASSFRQVIVTKRNVRHTFAPPEIKPADSAQKSNGTSPDIPLAVPQVHPRPGLRQAYEAPHTPIEEAVAAIWCEVLKLEKVGMDDNFFELGGHSLLATRVIARLREALEVELPMQMLFQATTVRSLALLITNLLAESLRLANSYEILDEVAACSEAESSQIDDGMWPRPEGLASQDFLQT
jgi:acyl carrier protein